MNENFNNLSEVVEVYYIPHVLRSSGQESRRVHNKHKHIIKYTIFYTSQIFRSKYLPAVFDFRISNGGEP